MRIFKQSLLAYYCLFNANYTAFSSIEKTPPIARVDMAVLQTSAQKQKRFTSTQEVPTQLYSKSIFLNEVVQNEY